MELAEFGAITSVVVSRSGEIVFEQYLDGEPDSLRNTRSCTKTIVGSLLGIAIERGLVPGVEARVTHCSAVRPANAAKDAITLRDLLTMSSCLECNDWDDASAGNEERMYPTDDWVGFALGLPVRETRGFSYCTAGVVCLGCRARARARRAVAGLRGARAVRAARHRPLALAADAARRVVRCGRVGADEPRAARSRPRAPGAPARSVRLARRCDAAQTRIDAETEYGYLWWLRSFGARRSVYMTGMGGNRVHLFPELDAVAVITTTNFGRRDAHALSNRLLVERLLPLVS